MTIPDAAVEAALLDARLRQHHRSTPSAVTAAAGAGAIMAFMLAPHAGRGVLLAWLLVLAGCLAWRLGVRQWHADRAQDVPVWLRRYRLAFLLHGLAWALLPVLVGADLPPERHAVMLVLLAAMVGGSLVSSAFDRPATLLFCAPLLLSLLPMIAGVGSTSTAIQLLVSLVLFVVMMLMAAERSAQALRAAVVARMTDTQRAVEAEQARRQLAEQHHLLSQLMRTTAQGYWFIDPQGSTVDVNEAMCRLLGRPREDVLGRPAREFFVADDQAILDAAMKERELGHGSGYEARLQRPDGTQLLCHNNATPLFDTAGRRTGSVGLWTDLSVRQAAERALRAYELAIHSMADPVSVVDEDGRYRIVNEAWCRTTGIPADQAVGRETSVLLAGKLPPERHRAVAECIELQQPRTVRSPVHTAALDGRMIETRYHPYRDEGTGLRCVVMVSRDVTEEERSRAAIAASADDLLRTLNATGDAIFASDAAGPHQPVRFVNERMLQMWGLPLDRASTLTPADILAAAEPLFADAPAEMARIAEIVAHNLRDERRIRLRDGRVLLRRCMPADGQNGTVRVWSFRDVTLEEQALRALRENEAQQRMLLDAFPGYIAAIDADFRYTFANERFASLLGRRAEQLVGLSVREALGDERLRIVRQEIERAMAGNGLRVERYYPPQPGRAGVHLEVTHVPGPMQPDGRRWCYAFGVDITARKEAERAMVEARDEAERANRTKSQFLAQMSHELRTPLNAIIGFAQLLRTDPQLALGERERGHLDEIVGGGQHLLSLINELLDFGRIESGQLVVEEVPVPLADMIEECLGLVRSLAAERGLRLLPAPDVDARARMRGDRMRIKQVLLNLLGNAVKYNRPGGDIEVAARAEGSQWHVEVRDGGRGLDEAQCARLFQPFERLDAAHSGVEGAGIGLALSRRLIEAMGGTIGVLSQPGVGSRFWFRLPRDSTRGSTLPTPLQSLDDATDGPRRVLYIEDNPVNAMLMQAMLSRLPCVHLSVAEHPAEGLLQAQRDPPALVLLDIQLPAMDGFEVFARLRAHPATSHVPVVAVSADASNASIDAALATGFAAYLSKPLDLDALLSTVRRLLRAPVTQ